MSVITYIVYPIENFINGIKLGSLASKSILSTDSNGDVVDSGITINKTTLNNSNTEIATSNVIKALIGGSYSTVGTGGDYSTLNAAVNDGKTKILVTSSFTETVNGTLTIGAYYDIVGLSRDIVATMGAYTMNCSLSTSFVGQINISNLTLTHSSADYATVIYISKGTIAGELNNCTVTIVNNMGICTYSNFIAHNCILNHPKSLFGGGFKTLSGLNDSQLIGTDSSNCRIHISGVMNNCSVTGNWENLYIYANINDSIINPTSGVASFNSPNTKISGCYINCAIGFGQYQQGSFGIYNGNTISQSYIKSIYLRASSEDGTNLSQCIIDGISGGGMYCSYSTFNQCLFSFAVGIYGNRNRLINCSVGSVTSGGKTYTINTGATNNIIVANTTEEPIDDSGTGTQLSVNNLF